MNKRIQELAEQAGEWYMNNSKEFPSPQEWNEKFAELIVRECIECVRGAGLADDVAVRNNLGFNDGLAEAVIHVQKHFGVEE